MATIDPMWPATPGKLMKDGCDADPIKRDCPYLFCDGNEVALWNALIYPDKNNQIEGVDKLIGSDPVSLKNVLKLKGHHVEANTSLWNLSDSDKRCLRHLQWAGKLLGVQDRNRHKDSDYQWDCLQTNVPELPLFSLEKLSLLRYLNEKELKPAESVLRVTTWASVVHADLRNGSIALPFTIDLLPFKNYDISHPLHFPSPLNAFLMFTQDWLDGFDHACIAAWNEYQEIAKSSAIDLNDLGFGIRWNLDLLPMWKDICANHPEKFPINSSFSHLKALKNTIPLHGQSASAALGIATLKLLAEAHFLGAKRLGELADEVRLKVQ